MRRLTYVVTYANGTVEEVGTLEQAVAAKARGARYTMKCIPIKPKIAKPKNPKFSFIR